MLNMSLLHVYILSQFVNPIIDYLATIHISCNIVKNVIFKNVHITS